LTVWHVVVSNIRCYGGRFVMAPAAGLEQPGLVACVIDRPGRFALLLFWVRILLRDKLLGQVRRLESDHFDLSGAVVPVQIDGDDAGTSPLHISCHSDLIELVFPPST
jgi:diacylglycerol kinase family enzyme